MKKTLTAALLLAFSLQPLALIGQTTQVLFPVNTLFGGAPFNRPLTITAANTLISDGQNLWAGTYTIVPASTTNPVVSLYPNTYLLTVSGVVKPVRFTVPGNQGTNILDATTLITSGPLFYFGTNGMANLIAGTNISFITNGDGSIDINAAGGGNFGLITNASYATNANYAVAAGALAPGSGSNALVLAGTALQPGSALPAANLTGTVPAGALPANLVTNNQPVVTLGNSTGSGVSLIGIAGELSISNSLNNQPGNVTLNGGNIFAGNFVAIPGGTLVGSFIGNGSLVTNVPSATNANYAVAAGALAPGSGSNALLLANTALQPGSALPAGNLTGTLPSAALPASVVTTNQKPYLSTNQTITMEQFGGTADGTNVFDVRLTNGSSYIYSPSGPFRTTDVGKQCIIYLDVTNNNYTFTTITNYISATTIQVAAYMPLSWTVGGTNILQTNLWAGMTWGSDNSHALQMCYDEAYANKGGIIVAGNGMYCFWTNLVSGRFQFGTPAMIHIHGGAAAVSFPTNTTIPYHVELVGQGANLQGYSSSERIGSTVFFIGGYTTDSANAINSRNSFIEEQPDIAQSGSTLANADPVFRGITFVTPAANRITVLYLQHAASAIVDHCTFTIDGQWGSGAEYQYYADPSSGFYGIVTPPTNNAVLAPYCQSAVVFPDACNACPSSANNLLIIGFNNGIVHDENMDEDYINFMAVGSANSYSQACGGNAIYKHLHFCEDNYGVVIINPTVSYPNQRGILALDCGAEMHPPTFNWMPFYDPSNLIVGEWHIMTGAGMYWANLPPWPSGLEIFDGAGSETLTPGSILSAQGTFASNLGANPQGQGLIWDMCWATNYAKYAYAGNGAGQIFANTALQDQFGCFVQVNNFSGSVTYLTNGLDSPALVSPSSGNSATLYSATNIVKNQFTIEYMLRSPTVGNGANINFSLELDDYNNGQKGAQLFVNNNTIGMIWDNIVGSDAVTCNAFNDGNWHDVALTYDGKYVLLYCDGVCLYTNTLSATFQWQNNSLGQVQFNENGSALVYFGRNRIWGRALSAGEIATVSAQHFQGAIQGLNQSGFASVSIPTNTLCPFSPVSGIGQIFIGGPGGTNIYIAMRNSAGTLITNKVAFNGQFP